MRLKVIGTGSKGNCYSLSNGKETLLLECGVSYKDLQKALNFETDKVVGCLVTHEHKDHCKGIKSVTDACIEVYCLEDTAKSFGFKSSWLNFVNPGQQIQLGGFTVKIIDIKHDVPAIGFYIKHEETGNFCFITDTKYCEYKFPDLSNIIVEANYCEEILNGRVQAGTEPRFLKDRIINSHMSFQTCLKFLLANDLRKVHNIVLVHLSDRNSHAERFKRQATLRTQKTVTIAENGTEIFFGTNPFN